LDELILEQGYAFILPMFEQSDFVEFPMCINQLHEYEDDLGSAVYAKDMTSGGCTPETVNMEAVGLPVYMPCDVILRLITDHYQADEYPNNYLIIIQNPYTGHLLNLQHQRLGPVLLDYLDEEGYDISNLNDRNPRFSYLNTDPDGPVIPLDTTRAFTLWGPSDHGDQFGEGPPHLHIEGQVPLPGVSVHESGWNFGRGRNCNCGIKDGFTTPDGLVTEVLDSPVVPGPCLPHCQNISLENFLLSGWLDPSR
jgi:hypothetical protein